MSVALHLGGDARLAVFRVACRPSARAPSARQYATQTSLGTTAAGFRPRRESVTVFNDDGRVKWGELTTSEKVARTAQSSFYSTLIGGGLVGSILVFTLLYTDVFSSDSSITQYNHAVDRLRSHPESLALLGGPAKKISALGDPTGTSWIRNRPRASMETDKFGTERMRMNVRVSGEEKTGTLHLLMMRRQDEKHWHYGHLFLDVPGQSRVWLEKGEEQAKKKTPGKFFGVRWG
ncbi:MAG: hypothetical protein M1828_004736 [Chrysothrix sp. TS-e1954]|nr:MAG: hypothetical protein M1828_004736 [Chrysothrix sp. TS-e1954]